jgi:predicted DNA-binding WGR domain protein
VAKKNGLIGLSEGTPKPPGVSSPAAKQRETIEGFVVSKSHDALLEERRQEVLGKREVYLAADVEQRDACERLAKYFINYLGLGGRKTFAPFLQLKDGVLSWPERIFEWYTDSSEEELKEIIDWAMTKSAWWVGQIMNYYQRNGKATPFDAFMDNFTDISMQYFADKQKEQALKLIDEKKRKRRGEEPKKEYQKEKHGVDWRAIQERVRQEEEEEKK